MNFEKKTFKKNKKTLSLDGTIKNIKKVSPRA